MPLLHSNQSDWNKRTILFVHGIGLQPDRYSEPLYQILRSENPLVADATRWHEVAYDHVNQTMQQKVIQFQSALRNAEQKITAANLLGDFLIDLVDYLFFTDPYNWINTVFRKELVDIVESAQQSGVSQRQHQIMILSHSLGTVVSYEALHSVISDAQVLGLSSGLKIQNWFTLGSPLAFIKAYQSKIPSMNMNFSLRKAPLSRPKRVNAFTGLSETNIVNWFNIRQRFDPVASLVPLTQESSGGALSEETFLFDTLNAGLNPHGFDNYLKQYKTFIMDKLRG